MKSKMSTDSFLAKILSFNSGTKKGKIEPLVILEDGKKQKELDAKAVSGITPLPGDIVLVIAIRNNLDDSEISCYYESSWSNCRIVAIASAKAGTYKFTGNYQFTGGVTFTGDLTVTKDLNVTENLVVGKDATIGSGDGGGDLLVLGGLTAMSANVGGDLTVIGDATIGGISFSEFHTDYLAHTHLAPGGLTPAPTGPPL